MATIKEIEAKPIIQELRRDVEKQKRKIYRGKVVGSYQRYIADKNRGLRWYRVPEFDEWELNSLRKKKKEKENEDMPKTKVRFQLSKNYQVVEVEVDEIFSVDEFERESAWAKAEAERLLQQVEHVGNHQTEKVTKKEYVNTDQAAKGNTPSSYGGRVSEADITTPFLKGKQKGHAVKLINAGKISLEQVNRFNSWNDSQTYLYTPENKKVIFGK